MIPVHRVGHWISGQSVPEELTAPFDNGFDTIYISLALLGELMSEYDVMFSTKNDKTTLYLDVKGKCFRQR